MAEHHAAPASTAANTLSFPGRLLRLLCYVWAFPNTLIGLLLSLVMIVFGAQTRILNGVLEVDGGSLEKWLPASFPFAAITLGHVVIGVNQNMLTHCRAHELVHVRQYERWGILFIPLYFASSLWQLLLGRHPYRRNYFEQEACTLASQYKINSSKDSMHNPET